MPQLPNSAINPIRLAVIGAGVMGRRHMRAAKNCTAVTLGAVFDIHRKRSTAAAQEFETVPAASLEEVRDLADCAVIATPTTAHTTVTINCLDAGLHCLVEKPLAPSEPECRKLIDTAAVKNLLLQVGHTERFNPAVEVLWNQNLAAADIRSISARRMNPPNPRVIEDDVVLDLMVHDLDMVLALKQSPVLEVAARELGAEHAQTVLTFADGTKATITASRTAPQRIRDIKVMTNCGAVHVDYAERTAWTDRSLNGVHASVERRALSVKRSDPLEQQLTHFAACIRGARAPRVSGDHALATLKLAWRIRGALKGLK